MERFSRLSMVDQLVMVHQEIVQFRNLLKGNNNTKPATSKEITALSLSRDFSACRQIKLKQRPYFFYLKSFTFPYCLFALLPFCPIHLFLSSETFS
jgi:hypothetical protein